MQTNHNHGVPCPGEVYGQPCGFVIKVSITTLLYESSIICPHCGLVLTINKSASKESLELLQNLDVAMKNVEAHKKISL